MQEHILTLWLVLLSACAVKKFKESDGEAVFRMPLAMLRGCTQQHAPAGLFSPRAGVLHVLHVYLSKTQGEGLTGAVVLGLQRMRLCGRPPSGRSRCSARYGRRTS